MAWYVADSKKQGVRMGENVMVPGQGFKGGSGLQVKEKE